MKTTNKTMVTWVSIAFGVISAILIVFALYYLFSTKL